MGRRHRRDGRRGRRRDASDGEQSESDADDERRGRRESSGRTSDADGSRTNGSRDGVDPERLSDTVAALAEEQYGEVTEADRRRLRRIERNSPEQVRELIAEGMPPAVMCSGYWRRQRWRARAGTPIPMDVERRNRKSELRSHSAAEDTSPAGETGVTESIRRVLATPGRALDGEIRRTVEDRLGESLGDVRIHTGPRAAAAAAEIDARAFTVGNHVVFARGEYDPESTAGQHLLVHELAHVRQQDAGVVSTLPRDATVDAAEDESVREDREPRNRTTVRRLVDGSVVGIEALSGSTVYLQRHENQPRDDLGRFDERDRDAYEGKKYGYRHRPPYAPGQVEAVWQQALERSSNGRVHDPNTGAFLGTVDDYGDLWEMGHKPEREYRYLVEYYLLDVITETEFVDAYQDPEHYRPEEPSANASHRYERQGQYWRDKWGDLEEHRDE